MNIYFAMWMVWMLGVMLPLVIWTHIRLNRLHRNYSKPQRSNSFVEKFLSMIGWGIQIDPLTRKILIASIVAGLIWFAFGFYLKFQI